MTVTSGSDGVGSNPSTVSQPCSSIWIEHRNEPSSPHSPAGKTDSSRDKTALGMTTIKMDAARLKSCSSLNSLV